MKVTIQQMENIIEDNMYIVEHCEKMIMDDPNMSEEKKNFLVFRAEGCRRMADEMRVKSAHVEGLIMNVNKGLMANKISNHLGGLSHALSSVTSNQNLSYSIGASQRAGSDLARLQGLNSIMSSTIENHSKLPGGNTGIITNDKGAQAHIEKEKERLTTAALMNSIPAVPSSNVTLGRDLRSGTVMKQEEFTDDSDDEDEDISTAKLQKKLELLKS
jgi:hypothetical protein